MKKRKNVNNYIADQRLPSKKILEQQCRLDEQQGNLRTNLQWQIADLSNQFLLHVFSYRIRSDKRIIKQPRMLQEHSTWEIYQLRACRGE